MPRFPKPFFKEGRGVWYVEIRKKQHILGPHREVALTRYHELMREKPKPVHHTMALGIVDAFFGCVKDNKSPPLSFRNGTPKKSSGQPPDRADARLQQNGKPASARIAAGVNRPSGDQASRSIGGTVRPSIPNSRRQAVALGGRPIAAQSTSVSPVPIVPGEACLRPQPGR